MLPIFAAVGTSASADSAKVETLRRAGEKAGIDIGTAVAPDALADEAYAEILAREFNVVEAENAMKFGPIHPLPDRYHFADADRLAEFAAAHNMKMRGHTLVWHNQQPAWLTGDDSLAETLRTHIDTVVSRYAHAIDAWDVVNEAFDDDGTMRSTIWYDQPGIGFAGQGTAYIEESFRWTRAADANARLFYNDYDSEAINPKSNAIYAMCRDFVSRGVPIDGVGLQGHLTVDFDRPETLASFEANLRRFAELDLDIHITELDVRLTDASPESLASQAALYRKFVEICRRQPRVKLIQLWGFSDKHSWIPGWFAGQGWALPWDENYRPKPAYPAILEALS